ncbi:MAG: VIT1/CCC1 transporter family protein [Candidatus Pacearchaeota archaeon]|nr:VIT1/CCC1 transporter family protein [Candidatus Pacearchaeota archaeon]
MLNPLSKKNKSKYAGSIVLGLNDAIVEITGTLIGLTFALQNGILIASTGFIVGIAASLSMGASKYLSERESGQKRAKAIKSSAYTGIAYLLTVLVLISPYIFLQNIYLASITMLFCVVIIIAIYSYYISNMKSIPFKTRFLRMLSISLGVALISFAIGLLVRNYIGVDV